MAEWAQHCRPSFPSLEDASRDGFEGEPCVPSAALRFSIPKVQAPSWLVREKPGCWSVGRDPGLRGPSPPHTPPHAVHTTTGSPLPARACSAQLGACHLEGLWLPQGRARAWRSPLASWRLQRPEGSTPLLVLLQRPGRWAGWALASWPPGPWQMSSVCKRETGEGGLLSWRQ